MAEYRALAQNTYKFVTEMVLHNNGEIDNSAVANLPRIKVILNNRTKIRYQPVFPVGSTVASSAAPAFQLGQNYENGTSALTARDEVSIAAAGLLPTSYDNTVVVDGAMYYGYKHATYLCHYEYSYQTSGTLTIGDVLWPAATLKVVRYEDATRSIIPELYELKETFFERYQYTTGTYKSGYRAHTISVPKVSSDLILAMSIEYPKYDITFNDNGYGLSYSVDDGATFHGVTAGLKLEQIEHVVLKNESETTKAIGTTSGGAQIASIAAGGTYVAVPTASGVWYNT